MAMKVNRFGGKPFFCDHRHAKIISPCQNVCFVANKICEKHVSNIHKNDSYSQYTPFRKLLRSKQTLENSSKKQNIVLLY